jgi:hypothetical protein
MSVSELALAQSTSVDRSLPISEPTLVLAFSWFACVRIYGAAPATLSSRH